MPEGSNVALHPREEFHRIIEGLLCVLFRRWEKRNKGRRYVLRVPFSELPQADFNLVWRYEDGFVEMYLDERQPAGAAD